MKEHKQLDTQSAEYVVKHAQARRKRGKRPSLSFRGISNPKIALAAAKGWLNLKEGDILERVYPAHDNEFWYNKAVVTKLEPGKVICDVYVDYPRQMEFRASDGVSLLGEEYGWIR